jgi:hypothetical protein
MSEQNTERIAAEKRLKNKRDFRMHLGAYLIVNLMFIAIWAIGGSGRFWPGWVLLFWGVAVAFHGWWAIWGQPDSRADIRREIEGR